MARTYWGAGDRSRFFFVFPGQATIGQAGCVGDDQAHLDRALRTYEVEVEEQTEAARKALQAQFPKVKRPKKWKFQHLSPLTTLVFAGGNYYVVQAP